MADKTTYLQLNIPGANARGWGSALNSNMVILDNAYSSTQSRINTIQSQLGEMNYLSFESGFNYLQWSESTNYFTVGTVDSDDDTELNVDLGTKNYGNSVDPVAEPYTEIPDFTGYYIINDYTPPSTGTIPPAPYDVSWKKGEILVKTSEIKDNQRVARFVRFPQALGGYYIPTSYSIGPTTTIDFKKTLPLSAGDTYRITFPAGTVQASWKNVQINDFTPDKSTAPYEYSYTFTDILEEQISTTTFIPPIDVRFFEVTDSKTQKIEIDYWFTNTVDSCTIHIELAEPRTESLWMSYIFYKVTTAGKISGTAVEI